MENVNFGKKDDDWFKKLIIGNNHPIDVSPETLNKNWINFSNWLNNKINENPTLKINRENNLETSKQLVKDIPLILSFHSIEKVIPGIIKQEAILSREEAKKRSIKLSITMGEFDSTVNLENHISTYFGNIGSFLYGNNTLIIKPEIMEQNNKNFFVIEGDTNLFQGDMYRKDIRDSILPCSKFYEFIANYVAAFYEKPIDYLRVNDKDHEKYLMDIGAPYLHILNEGKEVCYSPEIRINQNINIKDIIGFATWNDFNKINEESFKKFSLQIPHINFDPKSNKSFGETVSSFYKEFKYKQ